VINDTTRGPGHRGRPHSHSHSDPHGHDAFSVEQPGSRRMRGLGGRPGSGRPGPGGPGSGRGHGPRPHGGRFQMRRGIIRDAILGLLAEQPMHGYQVMQELAERSGGRWHPSAGSIYPTLQQLEDEGLVVAEDRDGRNTFSLTEAGQAAAKALPADRPWSRHEGGDDLRGLVRELGVAAIQVTRVGSPAARDEARKVLTDTRRALYRLLADDETTSETIAQTSSEA
jgi:DNA-binding PadR family transcriptional regulator